MNLHHLEWLIGEPAPDPELILYEVLPYLPAQAERIIEQLCALAGLDVGQADDDPTGTQRVRQAFGFIVDAARSRQALARSAPDRAPDRQVAVARPAQGPAS